MNIFKCERKPKQYCHSRLGKTRNLKKKKKKTQTPNKRNQKFPSAIHLGSRIGGHRDLNILLLYSN